MTTEARIEEIKGIVYEANGLSKRGENEEALQLLQGAWGEVEYLPEGSRTKLLKGLICHYEGRVLQTMGKYEDAVESLQYAAGYREDDPIQLAYTCFQMFICKVYGNIQISDEEIEETKMALLKAMNDDAATTADVGNMMQNVAYIKQVSGDIEKAISFYHMTEVSRRRANDERGLVLTWARLAECYKINDKNELAISYGRKAIDYFEGTGDIERIKQIKDIFGWE